MHDPADLGRNRTSGAGTGETRYSGAETASPHDEDPKQSKKCDAIGDPSTTTKTKRGMKPRSKRDRKRPRSEVHALKDAFEYQTSVRRLELNGKPLAASLRSQNVQWLRLVEPYPYTFSTFAKARWVGRSVFDVYSTEFGSYPSSYYETAITQGRILVSDRKVNCCYRIKGGDVLSHTVHRHEPGVAVQSPNPPHATVIQETEDLLAVDKPGTLPVHPCGGYHVQSLMAMLEKHYGSRFYTIHRIDRLTSGLVILGKTSAVAQGWGRSIMNRDCEKIYLARVKGQFPLNCPKTLKRWKDSTNVPWYGEWSGSNNQQDFKKPAGASKHATSVADRRKRYADLCWIVDDSGTVVVDDIVGLPEVFGSQQSVDDWLQSIETSRSANGNGKSSVKPAVYWFHLACPTRIAQHKDGICEAGNFDSLDDDLYHKTVKPAASSFGVVSYDNRTDSTLLVRWLLFLVVPQYMNLIADVNFFVTLARRSVALLQVEHTSFASTYNIWATLSPMIRITEVICGTATRTVKRQQLWLKIG